MLNLAKKMKDTINQKMEDSSNKNVQLPDDMIIDILSYLPVNVRIKLIMAFRMEKYFENILLSNMSSKKLCYVACKEGYLNTLIWARANGCDWDSDTCSVAAREGHLDCLIWAREHGCPWNSMTCLAAAKAGHLHILKWARENNCPWNSNTCRAAAYAGRLDILQWALANGCDCDWKTWSYIS